MSKNRFFNILLILISCFTCFSFHPTIQKNQQRVLIFSKTKGWKHSSIPFGIAAIQKLGKDNNFIVDTTKDASLFNDVNLKKYNAVIFLSTTGNVLNASQQTAFERYIQAGGGYVGIHSAAATEYDWSWYNKLMGAHFSSHPHNPGVRKGTIIVADKKHASTEHLPDVWERNEEWYSYRSFYSELKVLAYLDENSYEGGTNGSNHPIAWYHEFDGGRAFYTGFGHEDTSYSDPLFSRHILGGIKYAMGKGKLNYEKSYSITIPEQNRFMKTVLVNDLNVPMELAITKDGKIFYTELRTGNLWLYNTDNNTNSLVHQFKLNIKGGTGLIGVTLDPHFETNHYIYLYYAPPKEEEPYLFNLSRFIINEGLKLDTTSEKILLQVPVQDKSGSHHGGSLAWDKDGNLYLSTGDSSLPFPSNGYSPMDERRGAEYYSLDAQRASSNTNDLKGKILRIHPEPDGSYTIPKGNLFPPGTARTLPEIYVMGCRNPYRITVNKRSSVLYWGEIGPDAGKDSIQGSKGYDEFNQAKKAGNYGWPYFVGNNFPYVKWNFATNTAGPLFNPKRPVNDSPNNTGLTNLPPANPPFIWYPYASSKEFTEVGQGGRSAMVGEFYEFDKSSVSKFKFPEYYHETLFAFDWMRNWVMAFRFDENENYKRSEPFMATNGDFRRPIDLIFGKDGVMYMLEYGSIYGFDNEDARLVKIEYNTGNRPPIAKSGVLDSAGASEWSSKVFLTSELPYPAKEEAVGSAPLRVLFTSNGSTDPDDDDKLTYQWLFDGKTIGSTNPNPVFTYKQAGIYNAILKVSDNAGLIGTDTVIVRVGNELPEVKIVSDNNKSFFWDNKEFKYKIAVADKEDKVIDPKNITVYYNYNPDSRVLTKDPFKKPVVTTVVEAEPIGYTLINGSDCKACHTLNEVSVGPSYKAVAQKYKGQSDAVSRLSKKIITGGGGNWGDHVMSAHPQISNEDARKIVEYILSLSDPEKKKVIMKPEGTIVFDEHKEDEPRGAYTLTASYTDNGNNNMPVLTNVDEIILRHAKVRVLDADKAVGFARYGNNLSPVSHKAYVFLKNIDLTGINKFVYEYSSLNKDGEIEVRIDSYAGPVIARSTFKSTGDWAKTQTFTSPLAKKVNGRHDIYFVIIKRDKPNTELMKLNSILFEE